MSQNNNSIVLDVEGMTCSACAARIERILNNKKEVDKANVNFPLKQAEINLNSDIDIDVVINDIFQAGYKAKIHEEEKDEEKKYVKFLFPSLSLALTLSIGPLINLGLVFQANLVGLFVILFMGRKFHISSIRNLKNVNFTMDSLISIGSLSAAVASLLPLEEANSFMDTGGYIISFLLIGKTIEEMSIERSISISDALRKNIPNIVRVFQGEEYRLVNSNEVLSGDTFEVHPGEIIPLDGEILNGNTIVDESIVTGESTPTPKQAGSTVLSGSINLSNIVRIKVTKTQENSTFNQIAEMVKKAQFSKPAIQNSIDKMTSFFVPGIMIIACLTLLTRSLLLEENFVYSLSAAISVLVIACPCALGLATPLVLYKSSIVANSNGIIFKGYDVLERLNDIDALVFDKTGTLTTGIFKIKKIHNQRKYSDEEILSFLASVEQYSNHPIARSILLQAEEAGVPIKQATNIAETPGVGIEGVVEKSKVRINKSTKSGGVNTHVDVSINDVDMEIELEEKLNAENYTVEDLSSKFKLSILSGDNEIKTSEFAKLLDIEDAIGDLSPEEKQRKIIDLQKNFKIAYVGDGINDAPSLKQADVGIATSSSTEFTRSAGDIVLLKGDLNKLKTIFTISEQSFKRIQQNLFFALIYNVSMIPLATLGRIEPRYAAIAMALSSISVVINSTRKIKT